MLDARRAGKVAAVVAAGLMTVGGGLAVADALPEFGGSTNGHGAEVGTVPPSQASPVGVNHSQAMNAPLGGTEGPNV
jgi:hypothetical protein